MGLGRQVRCVGDTRAPAERTMQGPGSGLADHPLRHLRSGPRARCQGSSSERAGGSALTSQQGLGLETERGESAVREGRGLEAQCPLTFQRPAREPHHRRVVGMHSGRLDSAKSWYRQRPGTCAPGRLCLDLLGMVSVSCKLRGLYKEQEIHRQLHQKCTLSASDRHSQPLPSLRYGLCQTDLFVSGLPLRLVHVLIVRVDDHVRASRQPRRGFAGRASAQEARWSSAKTPALAS